jgi:hypothetical protein
VTPERALEIIDAYGADSRRWPAEEREAALLLTIADPAVAAALAEARSFDTLLAGWAADVPPAPPLVAETLIPLRAMPAVQRRRAGWWLGGAMAAALTGVIVAAPWNSSAPGGAPVIVAAADRPNVSPVPSATGGSEALAETEVFATVFTPTADEDALI